MAFTFNDESFKKVLNTLCSTRYIGNFKNNFFENIIPYNKFKNTTTSTLEMDLDFQNIIINECKSILDVILREPQDADIQLDSKLLVNPLDTASTETIKFNYFSSIHNSLTKTGTIMNLVNKLMNIICHIKNYYGSEFTNTSIVKIFTDIDTKYGNVVYDERSFVNFTLDNIIKNIDNEYETKSYHNNISINNVSQESAIDLVKLTMNYFNNIYSIYNYFIVADTMLKSFNEYIKSSNFNADYFNEELYPTDATNHYNIISLCVMIIILTISIIAEYDQFKFNYNKARY